MKPDYDKEEVIRADGDSICFYCLKAFKKHPRPDEDVPTIRRLCRGSLVKL